MGFCNLKRSKCCGIFIILILQNLIGYILILHHYPNLHPMILNFATITVPIPTDLTKSNDSFPKMVIGLGAAKSSSSTFTYLLKKVTPSLYEPFHYDYLYVIRGELSYWLSCHQHIGNYLIHNFKKISRCDLNEYFNKALSAYKKRYYQILQQSQNQKIIFMEKTPSYFTHYQTPNALTYFAQSTQKIYFYVLLRHPIKRLWSHYWMHYLKNLEQNVNIHQMENIILSDLERVRLRYPIFMKLMSLLKYSCKNKSVNSEILRLYEMSQMKEMTVYNEWEEGFACLFKSCYYPIILHWQKLMNESFFVERFRIIQTEYFIKHQKETLHELLCWVNGGEIYEYDSEKCMQNNAGIPEKFYKRALPKEKKSSWAPSNVNVNALNMSVALRVFYNDCNERLYEFIKMNPKIVLGNRAFIPFEQL